MSPGKNKIDNYSTNVRVGFLKRFFIYTGIYIFWYIFPQKTKQFIIKQFFSPRSYKISGQEKQYLEKAEPFKIIVNDQKVQCWKWGVGPVFIFVHGWNGRGVQFYSFFDKIVNGGYSVVSFDGPGHGESEGKTSSYFQMTDAVRAIINHCDPKNIRGIIGHSFGASAIINALSKELQQIPAVLIAPAIKLKELLDKTFRTHGIPMRIFYSVISDYEEKYKYSFQDDNPFNLLRTFNLKALIIHDWEDQVIPFVDSEATANLYSSINLFRTDGLGHKRILNDDVVINKSINYPDGFISNNTSNKKRKALISEI